MVTAEYVIAGLEERVDTAGLPPRAADLGGDVALRGGDEGENQD